MTLAVTVAADRRVCQPASHWQPASHQQFLAFGAPLDCLQSPQKATQDQFEEIPSRNLNPPSFNAGTSSRSRFQRATATTNHPLHLVLADFLSVQLEVTLLH